MSSERFSSDQLLEILSLSENATAIYTGEEILIQTANDAMIRFWGKDRSVIGKPMAEAIPELIGQPFIPILQNVWRTGKTYESRNTPAELVVDGVRQLYYFDFTYRAILDETAKVKCILHTCSDVTELVQERQTLDEEQALNAELAHANQTLESALQELNETNEKLERTKQVLQNRSAQLKDRVFQNREDLARTELRLANILEQAPLAVNVLEGPEFIISLANDRMLKLWNETPDVIGQPYAKVRSLPQTKPYIKILAEVYRTGVPYTGNEARAFTYHGREQEWGYFNFTYQPIKDADGEVNSVLTIVEDVTEKVLAREKVAEVNSQLGFALDAAMMGYWQIDVATMQLTSTPRLKELFGFYPADEMTIEDAVAQISEEFREQAAEAVNLAIQSGGSYDQTYSVVGRRDNKLRWLHTQGTVGVDHTGTVTTLTGVVIDITQEITARHEIEALNDELSAINEELTQSNLELNALNTAQNSTNNELASLVEKLNISQDELQLAIDAANLATFDLNPKTGRFKGNERLKSWFGLQPQDEIELQKATDVIIPEDRERVILAIQHALFYENGGDYDTYYTIENPQNGMQRIVRAKGKALFDDTQQPIRLSGVIQDVTDLKQEEQRKNDFIGMVSHELKTPITSLSAYLQMLQAKAKKAEDVFTFAALEKANKQVKKMTSMVNSFLNVSRLESSEISIAKTYFDLDQLMKELEQEIDITITSHRIVFHSCEQIKVSADRDKIGQVINNFISNAVKYSPAGSVVTVSCDLSDDEAIVSVTDEGMGISAEDQKQLFQRYYRVKNQPPTISGFGIGLYVSAEIIHRHSGKIGVESGEGTGSRFWFSLPL